MPCAAADRGHSLGETIAVVAIQIGPPAQRVDQRITSLRAVFPDDGYSLAHGIRSVPFTRGERLTGPVEKAEFPGMGRTTAHDGGRFGKIGGIISFERNPHLPERINEAEPKPGFLPAPFQLAGAANDSKSLFERSD